MLEHLYLDTCHRGLELLMISNHDKFPESKFERDEGLRLHALTGLIHDADVDFPGSLHGSLTGNS